MVLSNHDFLSPLKVYSDGQRVIGQQKRWRNVMDDAFCPIKAGEFLHQGWDV
jgi:hypothetical protein